ncbi:hypothetical protein L596_025325 [Steinernema carpocapsae]|uniref:Uncharacterized protein n=1 Tax=Steinernema carpocapsae TaxID=34508 RepID=A0A4U5M7G7_STECR|nr:hypothetical protein L596_025325 [Steinernema carpocapsae]
MCVYSAGRESINGLTYRSSLVHLSRLHHARCLRKTTSSHRASVPVVAIHVQSCGCRDRRGVVCTHCTRCRLGGSSRSPFTQTRARLAKHRESRKASDNRSSAVAATSDRSAGNHMLPGSHMKSPCRLLQFLCFERTGESRMSQRNLCAKLRSTRPSVYVLVPCVERSQIFDLRILKAQSCAKASPAFSLHAMSSACLVFKIASSRPAFGSGKNMIV